MSKKIILVTGGNGFIGLPTTIELIRHGYHVRVLDRVEPKVYNPAIDYFCGRIEDPAIVEVATKGVYGIIHTAAMSRSGPSNDLWDEAIVSNIIGTSTLLHASKEEDVKKFVYCGSSTYYGNQSGPQSETLPPDLLNVYGITKYTGEQLTRIFDEYFDLPTIVLRYFNVYGAGQPSDPVNGLVMGIFIQAKLGGLPVVLEGGGTQTRDFIEVRDVARANRLALETPNRNLVINIGSGRATSIYDLAKMLNLDFSLGNPRKGDASATLAEIKNAKLYLNWSPEIDLEQGVNDLLAYEQDQALQKDSK